MFPQFLGEVARKAKNYLWERKGKRKRKEQRALRFEDQKRRDRIWNSIVIILVH